jgi:hypothetical protein
VEALVGVGGKAASQSSRAERNYTDSTILVGAPQEMRLRSFLILVGVGA